MNVNSNLTNTVGHCEILFKQTLNIKYINMCMNCINYDVAVFNTKEYINFFYFKNIIIELVFNSIRVTRMIL